MRPAAASAVLLLLLAAPLAADEVYLKAGGRLTGEIVEQTDESVTVDIGGGNMSVQMSMVLKIEKTVSPLQEYRKRAAAIDSGAVESWRELARWAENEALSTQAREAWNHVIALAPGDTEANQSLGHVQLDGQWVTEEESYRARGFVEFEGDWVTPDERLAILDARQREEEAHSQAVEAEIAANQAAAAEREAQEQAEHDAYWNSWNTYNDPFYWGGGYGGNVYWPTTPGRRAGDGVGGRPAQLPATRGGGRGR